MTIERYTPANELILAGRRITAELAPRAQESGSEHALKHASSTLVALVPFLDELSVTDGDDRISLRNRLRNAIDLCGGDILPYSAPRFEAMVSGREQPTDPDERIAVEFIIKMRIELDRIFQ